MGRRLAAYGKEACSVWEGGLQRMGRRLAAKKKQQLIAATGKKNLLSHSKRGTAVANLISENFYCYYYF